MAVTALTVTLRRVAESAAPSATREDEANNQAATEDEAEDVAAVRRLMEEPWVEVHASDLPPCDEDFHVLPETTAMRLRRRPFCSAVLIYAWLTLLLLGQSATTLWWLLQFRAWDVLCGLLLLGLLCVAALTRLTSPQVVATAVALALTGLPVLNVYSAVALFMPPSGAAGAGEQCSCWELLHVPTFAILAVMYFAEALPPVLKAEYGEGASLQKIVPALARISYVARLACSVAVVLYGAVAILLGSPRLCAWTLQAATCGKAGPMAGRGLVLGLHGLGLACAELLRFTLAAYRDDLLRFFLSAGQTVARRLRGGARMAAMQSSPALTNCSGAQGQVVMAAHSDVHKLYKTLVTLFDEELQRLNSSNSSESRLQTLTRRTKRLWSLLEEIVPTLRSAAPPQVVVALLLALRRAAPILAPLIVLLERSSQSPCLTIILAQGIVGFLLYEAKNQYPNVPQSSLQRLAWLVPNFYIDPSTRAMLGYSLSTVKQVRQSSRGLARLLRMPRDVFVYGYRSLPWPFL